MQQFSFIPIISAQYPVAIAHSLPPDVSKIANTNAGCAICSCIGCNHKLFCAVGHFSFVLWLLKTGQQKIHSVWKTTLLFNAGLLSGLCASSGTLSFSQCLTLTLFYLHFQLDFYGICLQMKNKNKVTYSWICSACIASVGVLVRFCDSTLSERNAPGFFFWVTLNIEIH